MENKRVVLGIEETAVWPFKNLELQKRTALVMSFIGFLLLAYAGSTFSIFGVPFDAKLVGFSFLFIAVFYIVAD